MSDDREFELIEQARRQVATVRAASSRNRVPDGTGSAFRGDSDSAATGVPNYSIKREIHRGGQGVVYLGVQESTQREVAIKVMREGPFAGPHDRARFEREVHVLAGLKHPNIVTVHDSGTTTGGFFFYAMDYIDGCALDEYVAANRPSVAERLRLFAKTCDAVNASHLLGVIHRDLKPGNICIDKQGEPHVLDFGLAKLAADPEESSDLNLRTQSGQFVGSLPWASPEQAEGRTDGIDIRTDVYSLGVVLFHLLTGQFPYSVSGGVRKALNNIVNAEPTRPRSLSSEIDDDLETIVLKCLAKQREQRYQSAGELSAEINRYLRGEAIEAKRDSHWYVLQKTMRRHRGSVAFAGLIAVLLMMFSGVLTVMYWRQMELRATAESQAEVARAERDRAEQSRSRAQRVQGFVEQMLLLNLPENAVGRDPALRRKLLDLTAERIELELVDEPEVEAAVRVVIGRVYNAFSAYDSAAKHLSRALEIQTGLFGAAHPTVADTQVQLAGVRRRMGKTQQAEALLTSALNTLSQNDECDRQAVALALHEFGVLYIETGRWLQSEAHLREALRLRRNQEPVDQTAVASVTHDLGVLLNRLARPEEAEPLLREALAVQLKIHEGLNEAVVRGSYSLAALLIAREDYDEAEELLTRAEQIAGRLYGGEHVTLSHVRKVRATALLRRGRHQEAADLCRSSLESARALLGKEHPIALGIMVDLAFSLTRTGQRDEAESLLREAMEIGKSTFGQSHPNFATMQFVLGNLLRVQNRFDEAEPLIRSGRQARRGSLGEDHPDTVSATGELAYLLALQRRYEEAAPLFARVLEANEMRLGRGHARTAIARSHYGAALGNLRQYAEAEVQLVAAVEVFESLDQINGMWGQSTLRRLIGVYRAWGRTEEAARYEKLLAGAAAADP